MSIKPLISIFRENAWAVLCAALFALYILTLSYAGTKGDERWQTNEKAKVQSDAISALSATLSPLPSKVQRLEEWQADQKVVQVANDSKFASIAKDLTDIKVQNAGTNALLGELIKSNERVLHRLDDPRGKVTE